MEYIRTLRDLAYDWVKYDRAYRKLHASNPAHYPFNQSSSTSGHTPIPAQSVPETDNYAKPKSTQSNSKPKSK